MLRSMVKLSRSSNESGASLAWQGGYKKGTFSEGAESRMICPGENKYEPTSYWV